ncbi:MAG: 16S rRNA (uracil(1498)-N(3))-methyltransferase [Bacteroidota bacterium]
MHIFYQPDLTQNEIFLNEEESKHCVRVLRLKKSDEVELIDGKGTSAIANIIDDNPKRCLLNISLRTAHQALRTYKLHIAIAPTKNFDRTEWFIEKAVEIGIDEISFIECRNSERIKVNMQRCEKVAISAMKQSKQFWLPKINDIRKSDEVIKKLRDEEMKGLGNEGLKLIAWCETDTTQSLHHFITSSLHPQNITILIGPEGDFTKEEVELAIKNNFKTVSFGENRLRTETAALYACTAINVLMTKHE